MSSASPVLMTPRNRLVRCTHFLLRGCKQQVPRGLWCAVSWACRGYFLCIWLEGYMSSGALGRLSWG